LADYPAGTILIGKLNALQTAMLNREKVLGFCTVSGGATSHVLFLAPHWRCRHWLHGSQVLSLTNGAEIILDAIADIRLNRRQRKGRSRTPSTRTVHQTPSRAIAISHQAASTTDGVRIGSGSEYRQRGGSKEARQPERWHRSLPLNFYFSNGESAPVR